MRPMRLLTPPSERRSQFLDENQNLIMAILETQNLGKFDESARHEALCSRQLLCRSHPPALRSEHVSPPLAGCRGGCSPT